jgi:hypothetical protein
VSDHAERATTITRDARDVFLDSDGRGSTVFTCECDPNDEHGDTLIVLTGVGDIDDCARCARQYRRNTDGSVFTWMIATTTDSYPSAGTLVSSGDATTRDR